MAIGTSTTLGSLSHVSEQARVQAEKLPDLLLEARKIANHLSLGLHGLRKRGQGDNFWQFRPYNKGEDISHIDWRRSARDDQIYVRDFEWQSAQTIWIWTDQSASMDYQSQFSKTSKIERALLIALTLAEVFMAKGERIGVPDHIIPTTSRNISDRIAQEFIKPKQLQTDHNNHKTLPSFNDMNRFAHLVLISDFIDDPDILIKKLSALTDRNLHLHFIEICDPAEERFPYNGRTEFFDPETGTKLLTERAEDYHDAYQHLYMARRSEFTQFASKNGWSYHISKTNRPVSDVLSRLTLTMSEAIGYRKRL
ncbi:DUF58 domain-containing protein [Bartonella tamiae]|uniref:DUF58 domain-containing protein n=1 Tax=Bartonella tamiae Th239 TaxID=1094558 RepID=J0QTH8_9HYPH|nr:DUF58 domain-containing protein [Bartonella tamiae]EJF89211.1 hypothetical protein ME5_01762 [Bartonella tamiae Th239]EJF95386.1 hypothetical protein MEG_00119 [Bartonella tamiae Th307]